MVGYLYRLIIAYQISSLNLPMEEGNHCSNRVQAREKALGILKSFND